MDAADPAWRSVLWALGPPGLLLAAVALLTVRESRQQDDAGLFLPLVTLSGGSMDGGDAAATAAAAPAMVSAPASAAPRDLPSALAALGGLLSDRSFLALTGATAFGDVASWALIAWQGLYYERVMGLEPAVYVSGAACWQQGLAAGLPGTMCAWLASGPHDQARQRGALDCGIEGPHSPCLMVGPKWRTHLPDATLQIRGTLPAAPMQAPLIAGGICIGGIVGGIGSGGLAGEADGCLACCGGLVHGLQAWQHVQRACPFIATPPSLCIHQRPG